MQYATDVLPKMVSRRFDAVLKARAFTTIKSDSLLSPSFPETFMPSAFHDHIVSAVKSGPSDRTPRSFTGEQWVYRHIDEPIAGVSNQHFSSFRMLVFGRIIPCGIDRHLERQSVVTVFLQLLDSIGLTVEQLFVTFFSGSRVMGAQIPADYEVIAHFLEVGIPRENIIGIGGHTNLTNIVRSGEPAGPRCEIFCLLPDDSFIEIGTVVFEEYLLTDRGISQSHWRVYGAAFGMERVAAAVSGSSNVYELSEISKLARHIDSIVDHRLVRIHQQQVRGLVDALRSLAIIHVLCPSISGKRRNKVRRLCRKVNRLLQELGQEENRQTMIHNVIKPTIENYFSLPEGEPEAILGRIEELL